ncbi:unnamed protein product [Effrenium voratum]|nr:unnamed protein product [Effrenium voratum]
MRDCFQATEQFDFLLGQEPLFDYIEQVAAGDGPPGSKAPGHACRSPPCSRDEKSCRVNGNCCSDLMFEMLVDFSDFLRRHNVTFMVSEGTLLGAVRDQDIIPYTADLDIFVPREGWEKAMLINEEEPKAKSYHFMVAGNLSRAFTGTLTNLIVLGFALCPAPASESATFISVKEPKPGKFPRSKSAGANVPRPPCPVTSYVESLEKRASALTFLEPQVGSAGSSGHPELCFKPCLYLAYGSKIQGADHLLDLMEAHLASLPAAPSQIRPSQIRGLANVGGRLGRLGFRQLVLLALRGPGVPGVQAALAALKPEVASGV